MKSSHRLNAQRERWSENLPAQPTAPVKYADGRDDPPTDPEFPPLPLARPFNTKVVKASSQTARPVCKDFVRGLCTRRNCWFQHPPEHSPLYKNIEEQKATCQAIQSNSQRHSLAAVNDSSSTQAGLDGTPKKLPVDIAIFDLEEIREKQKLIDMFKGYPSLDEDLGQSSSSKVVCDVKQVESPDEVSGESDNSSECDDHYKVSCVGPRQLRKPKLSRSGFAIRTMREKRSTHRGFDHQAYREFMKPVREFTWCSSCKSKFPNCGRCALRKKMGLPPEEPPPAEVIIKENAEYYKKLFSIDDKKSTTTKQRKASERPKQLPTFDRRYPPGVKRPEWDVDPSPLDEPVFTSWNPADCPSDNSQWDILDRSADSSLNSKASSSGQRPAILAPVRPPSPSARLSPKRPIIHEATGQRKPSILAPNRPADPDDLNSEAKGFPKPFVLGKRPEDPPEGTSLREALVCFNCWRPGHQSRKCKQKRVFGTLRQEELRIERNAPLSPTWLSVLRKWGITPMEKLADNSNSQPLLSSTSQTHTLPLIQEEEITPPSTPNPTKTSENGHLGPSQRYASPRSSPSATSFTSPVIDQVRTISYAEVDCPRVRIPLKPGFAFVRDGSSVKVVPVPISNRLAISRASSSVSSRTQRSFRPENARYRPVGSGPSPDSITREPAVFRLPNEIMLQIFSILLEEEKLGSFFPCGDKNSVYNQETVLRTKNIILDPVRKTNTIWRSLAQSELYQSVAISSVRSLQQFARSIQDDYNLSTLVKKVRIDIPFIAVDGWTPSDAIETFDEEKAIANISARSLSVIITSCRNMTFLVAKFAGAFRVLCLLRKNHIALEEVTLSDDFARRTDIKSLWAATKRFPNLKAFELEAPARCLVESRPRRDPVVAVEEAGAQVGLKSISLQNFPYVTNNVLRSIISCSAQLENLEIDGCSRISSQGLSLAIRAPNAPLLKSLTYKAWRSNSGESRDTESKHSGNPEHHLCSTISEKLGQHLVHLDLAPYRVCEKLVDGGTWEALQSFTVKGLQFRGCVSPRNKDEMATEESFKQAVEDADMPRLEQDPSVHFGFPRYGRLI